MEELTDCDASSHQINYLLCIVGSKCISLVCLVQECSQEDLILDAVTKSLEFKAQEFRVRQNKHNLKIHLLLFISLQYWFPWSTKYTSLKNLCFWKRRDIQPSMVSHTRNLCSAFTHPSAHTQQWTQLQITHPEQWAAIYAAAPGE